MVHDFSDLFCGIADILQIGFAINTGWGANGNEGKFSIFESFRIVRGKE
jgi:hypothetical protein